MGPLILCGGDKNCEYLGAGAYEPGRAALSYGTAIGLSTLARDAASSPPLGMVVTPASRPGFVNLEVGLPYGGAAASWLHDLVGANPRELSRLSPPEPEAPFFLPFLRGSLFHPSASGLIVGLNPLTRSGDLARAWLEGVVLELKRGAELLGPLEEIGLGGGGTQSVNLAQALADALNVPVRQFSDVDAGLAGAAMVASRALGWERTWPAAFRTYGLRPGQLFRPRPEARARWEKRYRGYLDLCRRNYR